MVRWVAVPVLVLIELAAFVALIRYAYGGEPQIEQLTRQGVPPVIA